MPKLAGIFCYTIVGAEAVSILSHRVAMINEQAQHIVDENTWPPDQPTEFTPLLLIQHREQRTKEQDGEMAKLIQTGDIDSVASGQLVPKRHKLDSHDSLQHILNTSTITKEVAEILTPLEDNSNQKFVLIEGAPGIGKTFLLKHIACQWGRKLLLPMFKIVLLICLRDPIVWGITSIRDLLCLFCEGDTRAVDIATACSDYLHANGGKDITFLFDGYDEFPENLKVTSLIASILNRRLLPYCGIVVSSRPHASVNLHQKTTVKVDILGFTEIERERFIKQTLQKQPQKVTDLIQYLQHHVTINSMCFVPFNMTVLLFLHKNGYPLPKNSTELCNYFICLTICRHLAKSGELLTNTITDLNSLPESCNTIVKQIAKLSLDALNNNRLVFTCDEIKNISPDILTIPGAINGFGLMQAVQHFGLTGKTMTFNFLHVTIQEYLAAYYIITYLTPDEELDLLHEKFWNTLHTNMFYIYVTLTKGQRSSFKKFLSGGDSKVAISREFLHNQLKCLRLFRCFYEAGDERMYNSIERAAMFDEKVIFGTDLSATDIECVSLFLTSSSHKKWVRLNLRYCYIKDCGLHILHKSLKDRKITITSLVLSYNGLTQSSASFVNDIVLGCRVEMLWITDNHTIGESEKLYTMLSDPSSMLKHLNMDHIVLSFTAAKMLFAATNSSSILQNLDISHNAITDNVVDAIVTALSVNKSLLEIRMNNNPISGDGIVAILQALLTSSTNILETLVVPDYPTATKEKIASLEQGINEKRRSSAQNRITVFCK